MDKKKSDLSIEQSRRPPEYGVSVQLAFDTAKQLTTLNAGSIVLIGTFLKDIFPSKNGVLDVGPETRLLIAVSFISFGVSLILGTYAMYLYHALLRRIMLGEYTRPEPHTRTSRIRGIRDAVSIVLRALPFPFFIIGVICFGLAVLQNLYQ
jgi:hypothetical protein